MKKKMLSILLLCTTLPLCGCTQEEVDLFFDTVSVVEEIMETDTTNTETQPETEQATKAPETEPETEHTTSAESGTEPETQAQTAEPEIIWGESYTTPEDVAEYIYLYGELPENFITKREAGDLGWESSEGNLWEVAPGMSIGGDDFGNYEGLLPDGEYRECDVNYDGGYRGAERIIYGEDGSIYYTDDHYESFTQLY